jgi:hypothetical protein
MSLCKINDILKERGCQIIFSQGIPVRNYVRICALIAFKSDKKLG